MLTTNQIVRFNVVVQFRIHIAIKYTRLSERQATTIFEGFINSLVEKIGVRDIDEFRT